MKRLYYVLALAGLVLLSLTVLAVQPARAEEEPAPGVARVSVIHGDVSTMRGDSGDWVATTVNAPIVRGDKISTGERSQTEIQLDYANVLRLAPRSEVKIADLARTRIQVQVAQGLVNFTLLKGSEADVEIDTPNMAVRPLEEGSYRIQVDSTSETHLIVRKGEAEVSTPEGSTRVEKGRIIEVRGTDHPEYQIASAPRRDDWDEWNKERDHEIRDARSYRYANRYYTGAHDLDRYGRWLYVPDYGWSWGPYVDPYWAPYRDGSWVWEPYWGWTWVSYEPWGWAPYHYGRWFSYANSWYWWPGYNYYGYYPTWAPAYVSFIGFGFGGRNWHFGFGFGFNSIGWCPLGPFDAFYPWWGYHHSYNVVNVTNITNITNVTNATNAAAGTTATTNLAGRRGGTQPYVSNLQAALANGRVRGAITQVSTEDFVRGRVPRNPQAVDAATLRQAQVVQGTVPAVPTRESLRPVDRPVNTASLPSRANAAETFFTRRQPPAGPRPFSERAAEIQQMVQQRNPLQPGERGTPVATNPTAGRSPTNPSVNGERAPQSRQGEAPRPGLGNANRPTLAEAQDALRNRGSQATGARAGTTAAGPSTEAQGGNFADRPESSQLQREVPQSVQRSGWQRFGQSGTTGQARASSPTSRLAGEELAQKAGPAPRSESPRPQPAPPTERTGWQRFGTGQPRAVPDRATTTGTPGGERPASEAARSHGERWRNPPQAGRPAPSPSPSREGGTASGPRTFEQRPAPSGRDESQGGFRAFTPQPRPAPSERAVAPSAAPAEPRRAEQPGWNRFSSRPESPSGMRVEGSSSTPPRGDARFPTERQTQTFRESPRSSERPPLDIRKPIITERAAPRSFEGGGSRGSWWGGGEHTAPSAPPRSFEGGGSRGGSWHGGAPSPPPRSFEGGGNRGGWGGAPAAPPRSFEGGGSHGGSWGGGSRSVPAAPPRSFEGGGSHGGGWGGGGGGRGHSAPAPASRGGDQRGRH